MHPKSLQIKNFSYDLPKDKIALHPVSPRDKAKLLVYRGGQIEEDTYKNLYRHLPENAVLVFNDTKVVNARIHFPKSTGAVIEVFCLEPYGAYTDHEHFFAQTKKVQWKCMIGKASKWKEKQLHKKLMIDGTEVILTAELIKRLEDAFVVQLSWTPGNIPHGEILEAAGSIPLPPYIKRPAEKEDIQDYQTIYSAHDGSVAAPTAGLHFTDSMLDTLQKKEIPLLFTTHHVGAGTFKPVTSENMEGHVMHNEWMNLSTEFLEKLLDLPDRQIISVGTTSTRALESVYWMGNKILNQPEISPQDLPVTQWEVYENQETHPPEEAIKTLLNWLKDRDLKHWMVETGIIIAPGYSFKIIDGLITNFHLPQSTLLLLVSALIGEDWKKVYQYALHHDFRFLSYGDGSILIP